MSFLLIQWKSIIFRKVPFCDQFNKNGLHKWEYHECTGFYIGGVERVLSQGSMYMYRLSVITMKHQVTHSTFRISCFHKVPKMHFRILVPSTNDHTEIFAIYTHQPNSSSLFNYTHREKYTTLFELMTQPVQLDICSDYGI
jgi:hypothetical protein